MEKFLISTHELDAVIEKAVKAAFAAHEKGDEFTLINRQAAARRLKVNVSTLWRWNRTGYLVGRKIGRAIWYSESEIREIEMGARKG